jgi:hypothetical protein
MVKGLLANGEQVVVIEQNEANGSLQQCRDQGAIIVLGDAADRQTLRKAQIDKARHIISLCGDDGANAKVAVHARDFVRESSTRSLTCLIHIADLQLYRLLLQKELSWEAGPRLRLEFFNVFDSGARRLFNEYPIFRDTDGDAAGITPRLIVVGAGQLGECLTLRAGTTWGARPNATTDRLRITLIGPEAEPRAQVWHSRYPALETTVDLTALTLGIDSAEFERADFLRDATSVYVCIEDEAAGLSTALMLSRNGDGRKIPIIVCLAEDAGLAKLLQENDGGFDNLRVFGLLSRACNPDLLPGETHEILARLFHEDYVRQRQASGKSSETYPARLPWEELPDELKESNRLQADHISVKLAAVGCIIESLSDWNARSFQFEPDEIEIMARMEHERWMANQLLAGASYGPVRDDKKQINPNLVGWEQLPEQIRNYNRDAVRDLPDFLARAGFQVRRFQ